MEGLAVKRRRVSCVEPNRIEEVAFARKYVSYLVPALKKMKEKNNKKEHEESRDSIKKEVKYEVDMALVLSADQASAWTNALKLKLSLHNNNNQLLLSSSSSSSPSTTTAAASDDGGGDEEEEEAMKRLRRLVPGGEEMCSDQEMVAEFKSYVRCLQMQVNILHCLAQLNSF
ncbi:hypothetical protein QN277_026545 [Acacia crassicarpa]|uniref:IBH1-like N-terminal domain-containing protein n=1 Tax=Acacia crassicarpa TaxID=499986 RepID=A0AAE1J7V1_9FABA|nr:hypothetical protein QN277_026545 [Acacia crassicarpa]